MVWRYSDLIIKLFAKKVEEHFGPLLIGKIVKRRDGVAGVTFERTNVEIDGTSYRMQYYRSAKAKEFGLAEYFDLLVKNQMIKGVKFDSTFRADEVFLVCTLNNGYSVELEMGFSTLLVGFSNTLVTEEEKKSYDTLIPIIPVLNNYLDLKRELTFKKKSELYGHILKCFGLEDDFKYELSDFYKLEKIARLFEADEIDGVETVAAIERIIYL